MCLYIKSYNAWKPNHAYEYHLPERSSIIDLIAQIYGGKQRRHGVSTGITTRINFPVK